MAKLNVHITYEPLREVSVPKYLGTRRYIDLYLKWDEHMGKLIPKISAEIGIQRSCRKIIPTHTIKLLYNAIISYLTLCDG